MEPCFCALIFGGMLSFEPQAVQTQEEFLKTKYLVFFFASFSSFCYYTLSLDLPLQLITSPALMLGLYVLENTENTEENFLDQQWTEKHHSVQKCNKIYIL